MTWKCTVCGQENDDSNQYCNSCLVERLSEGPPVLQSASQKQPVATPVQPLETTPPDARTPATEAESKPEVPAVTTPTPAIAPAPETQAKYAIVFVNSPANSLIGTRVPLEFDLFQVISVGRSPTNVLAIPDQEVSKHHAELTVEGDSIHLKDLNSTNGTYVFDGKSFQPVTGDITIKPNTILKFGVNTIVRIVAQ